MDKYGGISRLWIASIPTPFVVRDGEPVVLMLNGNHFDVMINGTRVYQQPKQLIMTVRLDTIPDGA